MSDDKYAGLHEKVAPFIGVYAPRVVSLSDRGNRDQAILRRSRRFQSRYWHAETANASRFGRIIAPPHALMSFNIDAWWLPDYLREEVAQARETTAESKIREILASYGFTTITVVEREEEYFEPFGPDDGRMGRDRRVTAVSPVKQTKVGVGVFMTYEIEYHTQHNERLVAKAKNVTLLYDGSEAVR